MFISFLIFSLCATTSEKSATKERRVLIFIMAAAVLLVVVVCGYFWFKSEKKPDILGNKKADAVDQPCIKRSNGCKPPLTVPEKKDAAKTEQKEFESLMTDIEDWKKRFKELENHDNDQCFKEELESIIKRIIEISSFNEFLDEFLKEFEMKYALSENLQEALNNFPLCYKQIFEIIFNFPFQKDVFDKNIYRFLVYPNKSNGMVLKSFCVDSYYKISFKQEGEENETEAICFFDIEYKMNGRCKWIRFYYIE